ncbi:MAG: succinate dehydrogenase cytochrome b subunit, partial [Prolixibacteraceae bacterium]|nr:succinate dehydrogenase cytochrome b subunit [Prolixibacteraceae bacterium]
MSNFFTASIGRKFMMAASGLFLILFLIVHLSLNLLLIFDDSGDLFNTGAHFMATNPAIKIIEPILALGFLIHILWSVLITWQNMKARPVKYAKQDLSNASSWSSRNMFILGAMIFVFLVIHLYNFYWKIKFAGDPLLQHVMVGRGEMENTYLLVSSLFRASVVYCLIYIVGGVLLGLHVLHGVWSALQTVGLNSQVWSCRLLWVARVVAFLFCLGFAI